MNPLSVIIPSRTTANLQACISAIRAAGESCDITVVSDFDNHAEARIALEDLPGVGSLCKVARICAGVKPFVYARNCNLGIRCASEPDLEYTPDIILLNDDALLETPGGFTAMQKAAEEHPEYGIIGATCNNVGNQNQWPKGIGLRDEPRMVCFVAVLIPRRTIDAVGFLDERFTGYGLDDDDYSVRVRKAGLKIGIHDGCYVNHGSLTSTFRGPAGAGGNFLPNMKLFIEKWGVDNWGKSKEQSQFRSLFA